MPIPRSWPGWRNHPRCVEAVVLNTKKGGRNGSELVEIGAGQRRRSGQGAQAVRVPRAGGKGKYLGMIRLDMVDYRTAVGVVIQIRPKTAKSSEGTMSPRSSKKIGPCGGTAPALDVYVGLLLVSVGALIAGILCLKFQLDAYL